MYKDFVKDLVRVFKNWYDTRTDAISAVRSLGAYEDSGLYLVNTKVGDFAFTIDAVQSVGGDICYRVNLSHTYPTEG